MGSVVLNGSTSGQITLTPPAVAGTNTLTLPAVTDTLVGLAATQTLTNKTLTSPTITGAVMSSMASSVITSGTVNGGAANPLASGTTVDFTSIPSWVKRITVMIQGVSTSGTNNMQIQLGTGATPTYTNSGYLGAGFYDLSGSATIIVNNNTGLLLEGAGIGTAVRHGLYTISNLTGNNWVLSGMMGRSDNTSMQMGSGSISLAAALTAVRVTTVGSTDTFDAGSINILYE